VIFSNGVKKRPQNWNVDRPLANFYGVVCRILIVVLSAQPKGVIRIDRIPISKPVDIEAAAEA